MRVFWGIRDWVRAIVELPVQGPLPCRAVLVPNERVAHALRRELIRTGHADVLAGTRFVAPIHAAVEVLQMGGVAFNPGEEQLRPTRLGILFRGAVPLRYFSPELLRTTLGWDEAFARTIGDLENAGLSPDDLSASSDLRLQDVAAIWRALQESAGTSWTSGRILTEAARLLEAEPRLWPFDGPVLASVTGKQTAVHARFVRAIPDLTLAIFAARPVRASYLERLRSVYGDDVAEAVANAGAERHATDERAILASFLFEPPDLLADPEPPRSTGIDGTVHLEEHAGLEAELEAAADWVAQEVLERGTPLEDIAVLMPILDPVAGMLVERLARVGRHGSELPVYVAGGLPAISTSGGARVRAVIHALRSGLAADALAEVLPALRTGDAERRHLSRGAAMDLAYSLGTVGGSAANPEGALEWSTRAAARESKMEAWLAGAAGVEDVEEQAGLARSRRDVERLLADLRAVRPALDALVDVAREVAGDAPLPALWKALYAFMEQWLLGPGSGAPAWRLLDEALAPARSDARCGDLSGDGALELIEKALSGLRIRNGRFGDPAVYVGTIRDAAGIPFRAVRVIGLAEGSLPSSPREDPVLPEELRQQLSHGLTPTTADHALADLHALDRVVRDVTGSLVLSAPRLSAERTDREPSSIFIEAAAALGRPNSFADRLLRLRPVEARLSPAYEIVEDETELIRETFDLLLHGAETGTLGDLLAGSRVAGRADEATQIVLTALSAGVRPESEELDYYTKWGLDGLVGGFIRHRDVPPPDVAAVDADLETFRRHARELIGLVAPLRGDSPGLRWLKWMGRQLDQARHLDDPASVYRLVVGRHLRGPAEATKEHGFGGDEDAYRAWRAYDGDDSRNRLRDGPLRDDLLRPLYRWMATRFVRLFPVVIELYERVKQRHQALDQVDLLIKLRDLLAKDRGARGYYQSLFDHIFVDEFQDTDPLQAEIILYLCEREPRASAIRFSSIRLVQSEKKPSRS
jgi:hypothetical protein